MLKKLVFLLSLLWGVVIAQQKNAAVIVVGRVLNGDDSTLVRERFFSALKAKAMNRLGESESFLKQILDIDPSNHAVLYELANIYHAQNEEGFAEKYAREAVTVNSYNKWYWLLLADIYKRSNNYEQLSLVFNDLIRLEPDNEDYYYDKANALYLGNNRSAAKLVYDQIEKQFGSSAELVRSRQRIDESRGDPNKLAEEMEKLIAANPDDIKNYLSLSDVFLKSGNTDKALGVLLRARLQSPSNSYIRLAIAELYLHKGRKQEGLSELKAAFSDPNMAIDGKVRIVLSFFPKFKDPQVRSETADLAQILTETHPTEAKAYSVYGDVLYQDQKLAEARVAYKKALEYNPEIYLIWEQVLRIDISSRDFTSAIADGEEALSLFPNQAPLYFYTALAYSQTGKYEKSVTYLKNAGNLEVEDKGFRSQLFSSMGDSYNALKKYKESDEAYKRALELTPDNTYVLNNYAYYLSLRGEDLSKAAAMSLRSNELQPNNASFQDTYAWVLFKQKKFEDARLWIEKAIKSNSNSGVLAEHYGDILFHLGEKDRALMQWKSAKEKGVKSGILERKINEGKYFE